MRHGFLFLAITALATMTVGCEHPFKSCDSYECGFRGVTWQKDVDNVTDDGDLELAFRNLHHDRYSRAGDELEIGPALGSGKMVPVHQVLYGFCDDQFFEGIMLIDRSYRQEMERMFGAFFGSTRSNFDETVTYQRGDVVGRIAPAEFEAGKIECVIAYLPLWRICEGYANGVDWYQPREIEVEPCETCP